MRKQDDLPLGGDLDFPIDAVPRDLPQHRPRDLTMAFDQREPFRLYFLDRALNGIRRHAALDTEQEVGGILLGRHYQTGDRLAVVVQDHLAVPSRSRGAAHFEFDEQSVLAIMQRLDDVPHGVEEYVVGWYHSHVHGPPFMSTADDTLHRSHFQQEWHVSCVVGVERYGRPVGIWRVSQGRLEQIRDYVVGMGSDGGAVDGHFDYLGAAGLAMRESSVSGVDVGPLLHRLGVAPDGALKGILTSVGSGFIGEPSAAGLEELRLVVAAAEAVSDNHSIVAELEQLRSRLDRTRSFEHVVTRRATGSAIHREIQMWGNNVYAYTPGSPFVVRVRLADRQVWAMTFAPPPHLLSHMADGEVLVLTEDNQIYQLTDRNSDDESEVELQLHHVVSLPHISRPVSAFVVRTDSLWIMTDLDWHRVPFARSGTALTVGTATRGRLPASRCVLVEGGAFDGSSPPWLLGQDEGRLQLWQVSGEGWTCAKQRELPPPWGEWNLKHAARTDPVFLVHFDDGGPGQLGQFDDSLELKLDLLRPPTLAGIGPLAGASPIAGFCCDELGRPYVYAGGVLYRV